MARFSNSNLIKKTTFERVITPHLQDFNNWMIHFLKNRGELEKKMRIRCGNRKMQDDFFNKSSFGFITYSAGVNNKRHFNFFETEQEEVITISQLGKLSPAGNKGIGEFILPSKKNYIEKVKKLKEHIYRGDIYEINYCVEFVAENSEINPAEIFEKLNSISEAPHACLAKSGSVYIICSSPERFLKKTGNKLTTEPVKGTARRGKTPEEDEQLKNELRYSLKEQTENVMAVDVARNDLSRIAKKGTVKTDELFGVYSFRQVHQMISTVSCELRENCSFGEIIEATFPMASMTGAPKIRAMELISEYENFERGFYSGAIGTIDANGDFDLAVVIRSIIYDEEKKRVSFAVGSAITAMSDPEQEWNECMLKAKAMMQVLGQK